jgi:hypothetical protein
MLKQDEATNPNSCWNKGREDERMFVLLARDAAAPETLRFWAHRRVELGKNKPDDPQIVEALDCADRMEDEAKRINYRPHGGGMAGHDDETLRLRPGGFYESRAGDVWCCYRIDGDAPDRAKARCVMVESGRHEYFFEDGRYDSGGAREHTLVRVVPPSLRR